MGRVRLIALAAAALVAVAAGAASPATPQLKVVAKNLNNPRKIFIAPGGAVYVTESGTGGPLRFSLGRIELARIRTATPSATSATTNP